MEFSEIIRMAAEESIGGIRRGDKESEVKAIQDYIKNAELIIVPNKNGLKLDSINQALNEFGLNSAICKNINTNFADCSRLPAINKCLMAVDQFEANLFIARGRLGLPGSGSLLIFMDSKGRILTAGSSPSHVIHKNSLGSSVYNETVQALERIGLKKL